MTKNTGDFDIQEITIKRLRDESQGSFVNVKPFTLERFRARETLETNCFLYSNTPASYLALKATCLMHFYFLQTIFVLVHEAGIAARINALATNY